MLNTVVSGWSASHSPQVVVTTGSSSSLMPLSTNSPTAGTPVNWFQRVLVFRSYISLLLRYNRPEVPNSTFSPLMLVEYTIPAPQRVQ